DMIVDGYTARQLRQRVGVFGGLDLQCGNFAYQVETRAYTQVVALFGNDESVKLMIRSDLGDQMAYVLQAGLVVDDDRLGLNKLRARLPAMLCAIGWSCHALQQACTRNQTHGHAIAQYRDQLQFNMRAENSVYMRDRPGMLHGGHLAQNTIYGRRQMLGSRKLLVQCRSRQHRQDFRAQS